MSNLKLFVLGDIFLRTKSGSSPFKNIKELFPKDALVFGNLETVLSIRGNPIEKRVPLRVNPEKIHYLKDARFSIVNIANNHIMDYGEEGLSDTIDVLRKSNIKFIGAGRNIKEAMEPELIKKNGLRIGFIGFTSAGIIAKEESIGCASLTKEFILNSISELRKEVDVLVVSLHWGIEYVFYPSPEQQNLARLLIDKGADLIIGHHPHVIQGIEEYKNKLIIYSLGNCNFGVDQDKNYKGADIGLIISIEFLKEKIKNYEIIPMKIDSNYVPYLLKGNEKSQVLDFMKKISVPLQDKITPKFWYEKASVVYLSSQIESYFIRIKRYGLKHLYIFIRWLLTPFVLKMILGCIRHRVKNISIWGLIIKK